MVTTDFFPPPWWSGTTGGVVFPLDLPGDLFLEVFFPDSLTFRSSPHHPTERFDAPDRTNS